MCIYIYIYILHTCDIIIYIYIYTKISLRAWGLRSSWGSGWPSETSVFTERQPLRSPSGSPEPHFGARLGVRNPFGASGAAVDPLRSSTLPVRSPFGIPSEGPLEVRSPFGAPSGIPSEGPLGVRSPFGAPSESLRSPWEPPETRFPAEAPVLAKREPLRNPFAHPHPHPLLLFHAAVGGRLGPTVPSVVASGFSHTTGKPFLPESTWSASLWLSQAVHVYARVHTSIYIYIYMGVRLSRLPCFLQTQYHKHKWRTKRINRMLLNRLDLSSSIYTENIKGHMQNNTGCCQIDLISQDLRW